MQKPKRLLKPLHIDTQLMVLSENYLMNTNMTGFRWFKNSCIILLLTNVASALKGLTMHRKYNSTTCFRFPEEHH